jgi:segregation and condensation protein A
MDLSTSTHHTQYYSVATPIFEGPLDLLLHLIERAELDITRLALAQVTDQYLAHLRRLEDRSPEEVSAFLVIAARLIQIKSEALLPRPPIRSEGEEDPGEALARQLILYKRFKAVGDGLAARDVAGLRTYLRLAPPPHVEGILDLSGMGVADLAAAARAIFSAVDTRPELRTVVSAPRITIREKIHLIAQQLRQRGLASFQTLLEGRQTRLDVVVTFLAMLELIKRHFIVVRQEQLFGNIELETSEAWDDDEEFELEFGE